MGLFKRSKPAANEPVTVQRYTGSGKKEVVALDSPKDARKLLNRIAREHGNTPGVTVKGTPNGLTVEGADGKPVTHYNIEKD
jgi:hypothetical protein